MATLDPATKHTANWAPERLAGAVSPHVLAELQGSTSVVACCTCGWRSVGASTRGSAELRWRIHLVERRAADVSAHAKAVHDGTVARQAVLVAQREATRARRDQLRVQRGRTRDAFERLREANAHICHHLLARRADERLAELVADR